MSLRTNYSDDVLDTSVNTKRKYTITENADDTISLTDETVYLSEGDYFGAADINATNEAVNTVYDYFVLDGWVSKSTEFLANGNIKETDLNSHYYTVTIFNANGSITQELYTPEDDLTATRLIEFLPNGNINETVTYED